MHSASLPAPAQTGGFGANHTIWLKTGDTCSGPKAIRRPMPRWTICTRTFESLTNDTHGTIS
jgi:hypothetical protein